MVQFPSGNGLALESGNDMRCLGESRKSHSNAAVLVLLPLSAAAARS